MSLRRKLILSAGSNWANTLVTALVGLFLVPVVLASVGQQSYGVWALLAYGLAYPMILESSFTLAVNRSVAFYSSDNKRMNLYVSASFLILSGLALLTILFAVLLSFFVVDIFSAIPLELAEQTKITCILVGVTFALKMLESSFSGLLQGFLYYARYNLVIIIGMILRAIFVVIFLFVRKNIVAVQLGYTTAAALSAILMYVVARISIPDFKFELYGLDRSILTELFRHSLHSIARSGSLMMMYNTMTLLVGWAGTASDVAVYTIACRLPGFIRGLLAGAQNVLLPAATDLYATGQHERLKRVVVKGTHLSSVLAFISCIFLFIFARELLVFWLRRDVSDELVLVMRLLVVSVLPRGLFGIWLPVLVGMGQLKWLSIISVTIAVSGIVVTFALLNPAGVVFAPAIAQLVILMLCWGVWLPAYGLYKAKINPLEYIRNSLSGSVAAAVISLCFLWLIYSRFTGQLESQSAGSVLSVIVVLIAFAGISMRTETAKTLNTIKKGLRKAFFL